ncbi:hypothetical protein BJP36_35620 [Moorena producens JHB]|uniref:Uncharacterized protein n=1 Tax=Moorena producens (strain JHB) TaxID=1454205 RepID=A0A9Q9STP3_MOOP1|nr:hypothetical protein [Moorena producens]WAN69422.1 hypothetical protein BJP36_35620 [Moorena producens JHB]
MGETTAVAHGEGLCAEPASAPLFAPWEPPRPRCLPKTVMVRLTRN